MHAEGLHEPSPERADARGNRGKALTPNRHVPRRVGTTRFLLSADRRNLVKTTGVAMARATTRAAGWHRRSFAGHYVRLLLHPRTASRTISWSRRLATPPWRKQLRPLLGVRPHQIWNIFTSRCKLLLHDRHGCLASPQTNRHKELVLTFRETAVVATRVATIVLGSRVH